MSFDLRPTFIEDPPKGQVQQGGGNRFNNCVPDSVLTCLLAIGYGWPITPQQVTDAVLGAGVIGFERFVDVVSSVQSRPDIFPNLPEIVTTDVDGGRILQVLEANGKLGFPQMCSFLCDIQGKITTQAFFLKNGTQIGHASCIVAMDNVGVTIWNVEGYEVTLTRADFVAAFTGGHTVFRRAVFAPPPRPPLWWHYERRIRPMLITVEAAMATLERPFPIPGPISVKGRQTMWNLSAPTDDVVATLFAWGVDGRPISNTGRLSVTTNAPDQRGPVDAFGGPRELGVPAEFGPFTIGVVIHSGTRLNVVIHDEAD